MTFRHSSFSRFHISFSRSNVEISGCCFCSYGVVRRWQAPNWTRLDESYTIASGKFAGPLAQGVLDPGIAVCCLLVVWRGLYPPPYLPPPTPSSPTMGVNDRRPPFDGRHRSTFGHFGRILLHLPFSMICRFGMPTWCQFGPELRPKMKL